MNEWFSSQGASSEQFACLLLPFLRDPPLSLPLSFSSLREIVIRERSHDRCERNFLYFFPPSFSIRVFYIGAPLLSRARFRNEEDWFIRIIEYSANKTRARAEWIESFEYSSINFTVTGLHSHTARECIIPPRD